jgi:hypothetical protein
MMRSIGPSRGRDETSLDGIEVGSLVAIVVDFLPNVKLKQIPIPYLSVLW